MCYGASLRGDSPSLVQLKATTEDPVDLYIEYPKWRDYAGHSETVDYEMTVRELKELIAKKQNVSPDSLELKFERDDAHMEDDETIREVGVVPGRNDIYVTLI